MASAKDLPLIEKLRTWRRDASSLHQYEAAAFVGDKVLSITSTLTTTPIHLTCGRRCFGCILAGPYLLSHSIIRASSCAPYETELP